MALHNVSGAVLPYVPYPNPVPVIVAAPGDAPLVCLQINADWIPYIAGACKAFLAASTWDSDDENVVATMQENAQDLIDMLAALEACPMAIEFRVDPTYPQNWQYSLDGGSTWLDGPDTASNYTPVFTADSDSPSGYDISVNGGHSADDIPILTADDPNAVDTNPTSAADNTIEMSPDNVGLTVMGHQIGAQVGKDGISIFVQKMQDQTISDPIIEAIATGDYGTAILLIATA